MAEFCDLLLDEADRELCRQGKETIEEGYRKGEVIVGYGEQLGLIPSDAAPSAGAPDWLTSTRGTQKFVLRYIWDLTSLAERRDLALVDADVAKVGTMPVTGAGQASGPIAQRQAIAEAMVIAAAKYRRDPTSYAFAQGRLQQEQESFGWCSRYIEDGECANMSFAPGPRGILSNGRVATIDGVDLQAATRRLLARSRGLADTAYEGASAGSPAVNPLVSGRESLPGDGGLSGKPPVVDWRAFADPNSYAQIVTTPEGRVIAVGKGDYQFGVSVKTLGITSGVIVAAIGAGLLIARPAAKPKKKKKRRR